MTIHVYEDEEERIARLAAMGYHIFVINRPRKKVAKAVK